MRYDVLKAIVDGYARAADQGLGCGRGGACADFGWHGGEPLLAGRQFFELAFRLQRDAFRTERRVRNGVNTNGTLIDSAWAEFFREHRVSVAVSLDGPPDLHDRQRPTRGGRSSYAQSVKGYQTLQDAGVAPGVVLVVTDETARQPERVLEFVRGLGITRLAFSAFIGPDGQQVSDEAFGGFLIAFFDGLLASGDTSLAVRDFDTATARLLGAATTPCEYNECGNYLSVAADGGVYFCDWYTNRADHFLVRLPEQTLEDALRSDRLRLHKEDASRVASERCRACRHLKVCSAGCKYRRERGGGVDMFCGARSRLFDHIARRLSESAVIKPSTAIPSSPN